MKAADARSLYPSKNERDDAYRGGRRARATPSFRAAFVLAQRFFAPFGVGIPWAVDDSDKDMNEYDFAETLPHYIVRKGYRVKPRAAVI